MFLTLANISRCATAAFALLYVTLVASSLHADFEIFMMGGDATSASIQAEVDAFARLSVTPTMPMPPVR